MPRKKKPLPSTPPPSPSPAAPPSSTPPRPPGPAPLLAPARVLHRGELARIEYIHKRLSEVRPDNTVKVTVISLSEELDRSPSLIYETFENMKEVFGAPIAYDEVRHTQYYDLPPGAPPFELHPRVSMDGRQALVLMIAARQLFPFGNEARAALAALLPLIDGAVTVDPATLDAVCSAPEHPATEDDARHFITLFFAAVRRQVVRFTYTKLTEGAVPEERTVHPLHLVTFADSCILVAHDPECNDRRNFELRRMSAPELIPETFLPPTDFDLKPYLAGGIGHYLGEAKYEVHVRFASSYVAYIDKHPWHSSQNLIKHPDGTAETTYRVAHTKEIELRVLAAAGQAEVITPPDVRARIRAAAEVMKAHGKSRRR